MPHFYVLGFPLMLAARGGNATAAFLIECRGFVVGPVIRAERHILPAITNISPILILFDAKTHARAVEGLWQHSFAYAAFIGIRCGSPALGHFAWPDVTSTGVSRDNPLVLNPFLCIAGIFKYSFDT